MKRVIVKQYACCLGLLLSLTVFSVQAQPKLFEGANMILITTDLADKEAYLVVGRILTEQGILFSAGDDCLQIALPVSTGEINRKIEFMGHLAVTAGLVKLTGSMQSPAESVNKQPMKATPLSFGYTKDKRKTSLSHEGFLYLNEIAKKLYRPLHGVISYKIQVPPAEEPTDY
ncbi:hypothetical protein [Spirosoma pulveris]